MQHHGVQLASLVQNTSLIQQQIKLLKMLIKKLEKVDNQKQSVLDQVSNWFSTASTKTGLATPPAQPISTEIGRASCREECY